MNISEYIVLDLETTGLSVEQGDRIIEIAAIKVRDGEVIDTFTTLVNPEVPLKAVVTAITGIEEDAVRGAPRFEEVRETVEKFIGELPVVGHNIAFDIGFLSAFGLDLRANGSLDTFVLATMFLPLQESYALEVLSHALGLTQGTHRALDDVRACHDLLQYIIRHVGQFSEEYRRAIATVLHLGNHSYAQYWNDEFLPIEVLQGLVQDYVPTSVHTLYCPLPESCAESQESLSAGVHVCAYGLGQEYVWDALCVGKTVTTPQLVLFQNETKLQGFLQKYSVPREHYVALSVLLRRTRTSFLSLERLCVLLHKSTYTEGEGTLYAKLFAGMAMGTFDGTIQSLKLVHDEYGIGDILGTSATETNKWYEEFLRVREEIPVQLMTHHAWCLEEEMPEHVTVHILQAQHFPKSISYAARTDIALKDLLALVRELAIVAHWHPQWNLDMTSELEARCDILWGMLGIWFTQVGSAAQDYNTIHLEQHLVDHVSFHRMAEGIQKLLLQVASFAEALTDEGRTFSSYLLSRVEKLTTTLDDILSARAGVSRQVSVLGDQGFALTLFSEDIHRKIVGWSTRVPVCCYTYGGDVTPGRGGDQYTFFPTLFRTEVVKYRHCSPTVHTLRPLVIVPTDLPDPNNPLFFRESSRLLIAIVQHFGGQVLGSFASRHGLERIFHYVYPLMKKQGIHVLVEGLGGSLGKLFYKYRADEEHSALLGSNMLLEKVDISESPIQAMIIQKLPFGVVPQGLLLSHKEKGFMEYGFPAMFMQLRGMFTSCLQHAHVRPVFFLLDNRLYSSSYGREVERLLSEEMTIVRVPMRDIPKVLEEGI